MANLSNNEIELLKASIQGNTAAFESIVKKYQSYVCAITYSAIPDMEKSEDMAQETFLHVWNNLSKLKDLTKFKSWLISITRNIISDSIKKQKHDLINKAAPIEQIENVQTKLIEPAHQVMTKEQQVVVQNALLQIPEKYREPLVLFYRHEQSVKLIAEQLDLSEELVKQHLSRGRKLLREQVAAMVEGAIQKTGPTKAFTSIVMASIAGLAVKGTVATAAAAGTSAIMSSISAKIIATAAVIAIGIGTVVTYNRFIKNDEDNQNIVPISLANDIEKVKVSNNTLAASSINIDTAKIQKPIQSENISASNAGNNSIENDENVSKTPSITLKNKLASSPYEYFLFTRIDQSQGLGLKTLVLGHITDNTIEFTDIKSEIASNYHWYNPLCVTGGKIYFSDNVQFFCLDLATKQEKILLNKSGNSSSGVLKIAYPNSITGNCLYQLLKNNKQSILQEIDFENQAYRDITDINTTITGGSISISSDKKHLAFFTKDPNGYLLRIVDLESGKVTYPIKPIQFINTFSYASYYKHRRPDIPIIWLDSQTVAFIRTEVSKDKTVQIESDFPGEIKELPAAEHIFSVVNINTGKIEDITKLPGNPNSYIGPKLMQDNIEPGPLVYIEQDSLGAFRIDLKNHKLVEDGYINGNYSINFDRLYYKDSDIGQADIEHFSVTPDGKRILWKEEQEDNPEITQLYYHDISQDKAIPVARGIHSGYAELWFKKEDILIRTESKELAAGWKKFQDSSSTQNKTLTMEARNDPFQNPTIKIETDKKEYLLHEPVIVSGKVTNIYNIDLIINKPVIGRSNYNMCDIKINTPLGSRLIDDSPFPYKVVDEVHIKPGESYSEEYVIEPGMVGDYAVIFSPAGSGYSSPVGYSLEFKVLPVEDKEKEQKLFEEKYTRLMDQYHRGFEIDPDWYGGNIIGDEVIGLSGMGNRIEHFLIEELKNETNFHAYRPLLIALGNVASGESLPFFKEQMQRDIANDIYEEIFFGIFDLYTKSKDNIEIGEQVLDIFLIGMNYKNVEIRRSACSFLIRIYNPRIETCFEKTIEDEDEKLRMDAGFYLAAAKWLELSDWLKLAVNKLTYTQYISACTVVKKLEQNFNISKGNLPVLSKEDFVKVEKIQKAEQEYKKVLNDWLLWSEENSRVSFSFFEDYRQTWWENDPLRQE